jgi:ABC-type transport system involved in multi-copper enzyme maturation permease subunit
VTLVDIPRLDDDDVVALHVSTIRVARAEWFKLRTLRSSWLTFAIALLSVPGIGIAIAWSTVNDWEHMRPRQQQRFDPLADPLSGFNLAQLALGVLGVLIIAGEYPGGMIRATFAAVPTRLSVLWSKVAVFATLTFVTMTPVAMFTFFVSEHLLAAKHLDVAWSTPGVPRIVIGVGLYLTVAAVFAIGLGAIIRNVAGGIGAFVGAMLVLPVIAGALPQTWADRINKWLPSNAGQALLGVHDGSVASLSPWHGFIVFTAWAVGSLVIATVLLRRRDA